MLITRETDYAIRTVRALSSGEKLTVKQICSEEHIPVQFAYKILKKLGKKQIIEILRGPSGGYSLLADLNKLTILDILLAVENDFFLNDCLRNQANTCDRHSNATPCYIHRELCRIQDVMMEEFSRHSLAEIFFEDEQQQEAI